jgi:ABC-type nitrate/sulfonate/bicarbonate transport systems, periplasmic components
MSRSLKKIALVFATLLLVLGSLPFLNLTTAKAADEVGNDKITIGTLKNTAAMPAVVANTTNGFSLNNVNVDVKSFDTNKELNDAITQGTVNVAVTDLVSYASLVKKNPKWQIAGTMPGYSALVANKKYKSIKSLKNKTIALDKTDSSKMYLKAVLKKNKMKLSNVKIKQVDSDDDRVNALKSGSVDAAILDDPAISNAKSNGNKILNKQKSSKDNGSILIVNKDYSKTNVSSTQILVSTMNDQIRRFNKIGNYSMWNDALREFTVTNKAVNSLNSADMKIKKIHKVKKSDYKKAFKYAKSQKLYKGKISMKGHVLKVKDVK